MQPYMPTDAATMTESKKYLWVDQPFYWVMLEQTIGKQTGKITKENASVQFNLKSM